jgi:dCMP deaminase
MPNQAQLHLTYLQIAQSAALLSKDPSTKVGACIVSKDGRQFSIGYNGFPRGVEETPEKWERPLKYQYTVHSEVNAILNCPFDMRGSSIYVTLQPCHRCLGALIQAGIQYVYFNSYYERLEYIDVWNDLSKHFEVIGCICDMHIEG